MNSFFMILTFWLCIYAWYSFIFIAFSYIEWYFNKKILTTDDVGEIGARIVTSIVNMVLSVFLTIVCYYLT